MVLKVDSATLEETKPILGSTEANEKEETDLKIEDAYKHITKSMRAEPLKIEKVEVALELFSTAIKIQNVPLAKQCTEILNNQLNKTNAVTILRHIYDCKMMAPIPPDPFDVEPSAPPIIECDSQITDDWAEDLLDSIRNNCLLEIDKNADYVLKQKDILELSYPDILAVTTRDTLQVSNEMLVYSVVVRWSIEECKRRTLQPQLINLKAVLRELIHAPRYGLMSKKEFNCRTVDGVKGPQRSRILEEKQTETIISYLKKKSKNRPVDELPHKGSIPRKRVNLESGTFHSGVSGDSACSSTSNCDKFVINFLTCWTAIFD